MKKATLRSFLGSKGRFKDVKVSELIMPIFVREGIKEKVAVKPMPGIFQYSVNEAAEKSHEYEDLGIPAVILFGVPVKKDGKGSEAYNDYGIIQKAIRKIKKATKKLVVIADCCFCEYTLNGECGILKNNTVDNDSTRKLLKLTSVSQAAAGADIIAPSGMITRMVETIREALDKHGFKDKRIMSYSAKYASNFYGPFREAGGSSFKGKLRSTQLDPKGSDIAVKKVLADLKEGADFVMVKPALSYLDIIRKIRAVTNKPLAAFNVSGEYAMVKFAAEQGAVNEERVVNEMLTSMKRAGADLIITYFAESFAKRSKKL